MLDTIPLDAISTGGAGVLLGLAVWLILTGRLVPHSHLDASEKRADYWRATAENKDATIRQQADTNRELTQEVGATVAKVMSEIQARRGDGS